jgi:hypothetical protein
MINSIEIWSQQFGQEADFKKTPYINTCCKKTPCTNTRLVHVTYMYTTPMALKKERFTPIYTEHEYAC